jgi:hypothetical protein
MNVLSASSISSHWLQHATNPIVRNARAKRRKYPRTDDMDNPSLITILACFLVGVVGQASGCPLSACELVARNRDSHVSLRRQFRLINRLRIQVKSCGRLSVTKQSLNCLYVFALVDKKGREAVAEVVKPNR